MFAQSSNIMQHQISHLPSDSFSPRSQLLLFLLFCLVYFLISNLKCQFSVWQIQAKIWIFFFQNSFNEVFCYLEKKSLESQLNIYHWKKAIHFYRLGIWGWTFVWKLQNLQKWKANDHWSKFLTFSPSLSIKLQFSNSRNDSLTSTKLSRRPFCAAFPR